jgi:hypothetical protein
VEVWICIKNGRVFIRDLNDLALQIICDAWWAAMNVDLKYPIAWNNSIHVCSWQFYLHSGIEETGSGGVTFIICHQVLCHFSEHRPELNGETIAGKSAHCKLKHINQVRSYRID